MYQTALRLPSSAPPQLPPCAAGSIGPKPNKLWSASSKGSPIFIESTINSEEDAVEEILKIIN